MADERTAARLAERPPKHGDVWIHKETGEGRSVLMVCGHSDDDAVVSGLSLRPGRPPYALPLATFLARHVLIAVDPELELERVNAELARVTDTLREARAFVAGVNLHGGAAAEPADQWRYALLPKIDAALAGDAT